MCAFPTKGGYSGQVLRGRHEAESKVLSIDSTFRVANGNSEMEERQV
jgi:hypothetical protein